MAMIGGTGRAGSWLDGFARGSGPAPKPEYKNVNTDPGMKARYLAAPEVIQKVVEEERARHTSCATDEKPLRVDVERITDAKVCYLSISCAGCYREKRVQINEEGGSTIILKDVISKPRTPSPPPQGVIKSLSYDEKIAANVKANAQGRTLGGQAQMEEENRLWRNAAAFTAEPFVRGVIDAIGKAQILTAAPLFVTAPETGRLKRKEEPKPSAKPLIDRLTIVRAKPFFDEEV